MLDSRDRKPSGDASLRGGGTRKWRFLIVDDDPVICQTLSGFLHHLGDFEVHETGNALDGLALLQRLEEVDCVFVDINMPGMDGIEFLTRLKERDRNIVATIITGAPSMDIIIQTMRAGASDFLKKPFNFEQFQIAVERMIKERSLLLENELLSEEVQVKGLLEQINSKLEKKIKEQTVLFAISDALGNTKSTSDLYNTLVDLAALLTESTQAFLWVINHERNCLVLTASKGPFDPSLEEIPMDLDLHPCIKVVREGVALILDRKSRLTSRFIVDGFAGEDLVLVPFKIREELFGLLGVCGGAKSGMEAEEALFLLHILCERASLTVENLLLYDSILLNLHATLRALVRTLEAKDPYTKMHSERVTELSLRIAKEMGCSSDELESLRFAGHLHDIGKIGIRDQILMKPGRLTREEYEIIKKHPVIGADIVSHLGLLPDEKAIIRHHHERWDGKGYPDGLQGSETPRLSRILAVADTYDAITSHRPYRKALPHSYAYDQIVENSGTQFDPEAVKAFCSCCQNMSVEKGE